MKHKTENVYFLERGESLSEMSNAGISLHCHTLHSKELLEFVPYYAKRIPVASYLWRRQMKRYADKNQSWPDFRSGYWEPPLSAHDVFGQERASITGLCLERAMISITDHDSINANLELRSTINRAVAPISLEWTVPFENAFFHIGVHNLPCDEANAITADLLAYTHAVGAPDDRRLEELFARLNEFPEVLIVLNHPIWDIEMIGQSAHESALGRFMCRHAKWIHALEINGFRSWNENQAVIELAAAARKPIISGGDRHCLQSNTMINITDACSFDEFVSEVRNDSLSRIAVTPDYHAPLPSRQLRSIAQILATHKQFDEGRRVWSDRVFLDYHDGKGLRSLTKHWQGRRPAWTYIAFFVLRVLAHQAFQPLIAVAVGDKDIGRNEKKINSSSFLEPTPAQPGLSSVLKS